MTTIEARITEALLEAARDRSHRVDDWPDDERDLYRELSVKSFKLAQEAVFDLRINKVAAVVAGIVTEAQAEALRDAAGELAKLQYARPGDAGRPEYERMLAIRRGNTDAWLRTRADKLTIQEPR